MARFFPVKPTLETLVVAYRKASFPARVREQTWQLLSDLTHAGVPLNVALKTAASVMRDGKRPAVAGILLDLEAGIARSEVSRRAARYGFGAEALVFRSIGKSDVSRIFAAAARLAAQKYKLRKAITSALIMPAALTVLLMVLFYMIGAELFPAIEAIWDIGSAPYYTQILSQFSQWFANHVFLTLIPFLAIIGLLAVLLPLLTGPIRTVLDRLPPFSLYKIGQGTGFIFTVMELARMGQTLQPSLLDDLTTDASPYLKSRIQAVATNLGSDSWGRAMQKTGHDFPSRDLITVTVAMDGTEGWIERFSIYLDRWLEQVEDRVKAQMAFVNSTLMILMVFIMGAVANTMMSIISFLG